MVIIFFLVRRGPATAKLPQSFTDLLAKKVMPPTKMLVSISQDYKLNLIYLKSFCENQLKQSEDSVDVIVEFGNVRDVSEFRKLFNRSYFFAGDNKSKKGDGKQ